MPRCWWKAPWEEKRAEETESTKEKEKGKGEIERKEGREGAQVGNLA